MERGEQREKDEEEEGQRMDESGGEMEAEGRERRD